MYYNYNAFQVGSENLYKLHQRLKVSREQMRIFENEVILEKYLYFQCREGIHIFTIKDYFVILTLNLNLLLY